MGSLGCGKDHSELFDKLKSMVDNTLSLESMVWMVVGIDALHFRGHDVGGYFDDAGYSSDYSSDGGQFLLQWN